MSCFIPFLVLGPPPETHADLNLLTAQVIASQFDQSGERLD